MATIQLLNGAEKIKDSYGKINTSLTNLNNNKLEKSGDTMTGLLTALGGIDLEVTSAPTGKVGRMHANGVTNQIYYHDGTDWREVWHSGNNPASVAANGYQVLASGLIVQWGFVTVPPNNVATPVTFPIAFPTLVAIVLTNARNAGALASASENITNTGFDCYQNHPSLDRVVHWLAIGW